MQIDYKKLTKENCKDAGLALVLICLICYVIWPLSLLVVLAIIFLVGAMTWPPVFKPFAKLWFALSTMLGTILSKIILGILFFGLVLPVGWVRRIMGKDSMRLKLWKKGQDSVFVARNHKYTAKDLENLY